MKEERLWSQSVFITIANMEKRYTNFGHKYVIGGEIWKIIEIGIDIYIYILNQEEKIKLFRKMSVRPFKKCIHWIDTAKISTRTHEHLRSWSRMKFLTILLYLGIRLMKLIRIFFNFKDMDPIGPDHRKCAEVGAELKWYSQYIAVHIK